MSQIYSGIQPSGELHIGNYLGAVQNWVRLQREHAGAIFCIVDYHALTGSYDPDALRRRTFEMALSLLAAGIDPARATLYRQSAVPEHTELAWVFNTLTPLGELERQTQYKDKASRQESVVVGILTYPVLQAADILLYRADAVPVGEDQVQHLELSREIARKWNTRFAPEDRPYFPEPKPLLTPTRRIMGLDGQAKMSKSMGNTIGLMESSDAIWEKLRPAVTDPARVRKTDPGTPEVCNIYHLHKAFSPAPVVDEVAEKCRTAGWGCIACKQALFEHMEQELVPIRGRAAALRADPGLVTDALDEGAERCRGIARETMGEVRTAMGLR
ncbi:tryptophan--tRNA ligase [Gemmatimonadetes bacterium T265]|nr:tryptophan--tRNA ligase [Gemmatimonadetes bacterium T265]